MNDPTPKRSHTPPVNHEPRPGLCATSQQTIDLLKRAYPIQDVLARYDIALTGTSLHRMACCPFHEDTHPSMGVFLDTNRYFCFGCGAKGDVLDLIQRLEGIPFREAVARLDVQTPHHTHDTRSSEQCPPVQQTAQRQHHAVAPPTIQEAPELGGRSGADQRGMNAHLTTTVLTVAAAIYQEHLLRTPHALAYLHARGIPQSVALHARLGYADTTTLRAFVGRDALVASIARRIGLVDRVGRDRLRGRLIIPEFRAGQCIWMVGRILQVQTSSSGSRLSAERPSTHFSVPRELLPKTPSSPKYLGVALPKPLLGLGLVTPHLHTARRSQVQSNLHRQGERDESDQPRSRGIVVVEGPFDLLTAFAWRLPLPCVALVGTYANAQQLTEVVALANGGPIWLALDADNAGAAGSARLQTQLAHAGCGAQIRWLRIPEHAKDLSEVITSVAARRQIMTILADAQGAESDMRKGGH